MDDPETYAVTSLPGGRVGFWRSTSPTASSLSAINTSVSASRGRRPDDHGHHTRRGSGNRASNRNSVLRRRQNALWSSASTPTHHLS
jgi:hypothetical protein